MLVVESSDGVWSGKEVGRAMFRERERELDDLTVTVIGRRRPDAAVDWS
jgi:hypothetical protein